MHWPGLPNQGGQQTWGIIIKEDALILHPTVKEQQSEGYLQGLILIEGGATPEDKWLHLQKLPYRKGCREAALPLEGRQHSLWENLNMPGPFLLKPQPEAPWLWRDIHFGIVHLLLIILSNAMWLIHHTDMNIE